MDEKEVNAINPSNNNVNNKTNTFNLVIGIATLLIALLGATFAYFSATARSEENDVTVKSAYVSISYDGGTEIIANNLIPSTKHVALSKYMKEATVCDPNEGCEIITEYDQYSADPAMWDRKCVDAKGKEVCYVYQFSVESDGGDGNETEILGSVKINRNQFENLSYVLYEVVPREEQGVVLQDKYGFDIIDRYSIPEGVTFDNLEDEENSDFKEVSYAKFEQPQPIITEEGTNDGFIYPVACLFGYSKEDEALALPIDNTKRCLTKKITNNEKHTFQLVIWLNETGFIQDEQGMAFEGTVAIEVSGGVSTNEYVDGEITGEY